MKTKWININEKMPILNEIIHYKGSPNGQRARYIGNGAVKLPSGVIDRVEEWKPKVYGKVTFSILHIDGTTKIEAEGVVDDGMFLTEYNYQGMCYGAVIPLGRIK